MNTVVSVIPLSSLIPASQGIELHWLTLSFTRSSKTCPYVCFWFFCQKSYCFLKIMIWCALATWQSHTVCPNLVWRTSVEYSPLKFLAHCLVFLHVHFPHKLIPPVYWLLGFVFQCFHNFYLNSRWCVSLLWLHTGSSRWYATWHMTQIGPKISSIFDSLQEFILIPSEQL